MFCDPAYSTFRKIVVASIFGIGVFLIPNGVQSATNHSATIQWAANQESDLAGYRVYHGTTSGSYGSSQNVGKTTTYQYANLESDKTHYFSVTAYDSSGNESNPSLEVNTFIQAAVPPTLTSPKPNTTLVGATTTFTWTPNGTAASEYWLEIGSAVNTEDLYDSGRIAASVLSRSVSGLPTDGRAVFVRFWWKVNGKWEVSRVEFTAAGGYISSFPVTITKSGDGSGTITSNPIGLYCGSTCTASFSTNSPVTLSANAGSGSIFSGWSGGGCSGTSSCTLTLSSSASVSANFVSSPPSSSSLSVTLTGNGEGRVTSSPSGLTCSGGTCTASFPQGTVVTLTSTTQSGTVFQGWNGVCSGNSQCAITLSSSSVVTATFVVENSDPIPPKPNMPILVNFQPSASQIPTNFNKDDGSVFTNIRGYGWNQLLNGTEQNSIAHQTLDTFVSTSNQSPSTWNLTIPNGMYYVTMVLGNPTTAQGPHWVSVEGLQLAKQVKTAKGEYLTIADYMVEIKDSTLSLTLGNSGQGQTTLNYLVIHDKQNSSATTQILTASFETTLVTSTLIPGTATKINPVVLVQTDKDEKERKKQEQEAAALAQAKSQKQQVQEVANQNKLVQQQEPNALARARFQKRKAQEVAKLNGIKEKILATRQSGGPVTLRNLLGGS